MKVNFEITQTIELNINERCFDLHNNFDFVNFEYKVEERVLLLRFKKSSGDWVRKDESDFLVLEHKNVNYLNIIPRDSEVPFSEDKCLCFVAYFHSSCRDINDSHGNEKVPNEGDDIIYSFESNQVIRINCDSIELIVL